MSEEHDSWYYQDRKLGMQTLGPVPWSEIERMMRDGIDATSLLICRVGEQEWHTAADIMDQKPELRVANTQGNDHFPSSDGERVNGGQMTPTHGLGKWIGQAWRMVWGDLWPWVGALLWFLLVGIVTLGICFAPLYAGLFIMALKRFRGEAIYAGTIFDGFQYFWPSWGLYLLHCLIAAPAWILYGIAVIVLDDMGVSPDVASPLASLVGGCWSLPVWAALFYAWVLLVDRDVGPITAIKGSWEVTKTQLLSYLGILLVMLVVACGGVLACYVGIMVTVPMLYCGIVAVYMYHFDDPEVVPDAAPDGTMSSRECLATTPSTDCAPNRTLAIHSGDGDSDDRRLSVATKFDKLSVRLVLGVAVGIGGTFCLLVLPAAHGYGLNDMGTYSRGVLLGGIIAGAAVGICSGVGGRWRRSWHLLGIALACGAPAVAVLLSWEMVPTRAFFDESQGRIVSVLTLGQSFVHGLTHLLLAASALALVGAVVLWLSAWFRHRRSYRE